MTQWHSIGSGSRSTVMSTKGIVCSSSPLAASSGLLVLAEGGNAFDASIAVAATEAVTVPSMCGLGGEAFAMMYHAGIGKMYGLSSTGQAPRGATPGFYQSKGFDQIPTSGPLASSPPGEVAAYQLINDTFGTRPLGKLLEFAIGYAEEGFPLSPRVGGHFSNGTSRLDEFPDTRSIYLRGGNPYGPGDIFANRELARTLQRVAEGGAEEFYRGELGKEIATAFKKAGGLIDEAAMAAVTPELYEPLVTTYRGYTVAENRPPSQGAILLEMLNILEGYDLTKLGYQNPDSIHLMIEAKKLAFADRNAYLGDPRLTDIPVEVLISKNYADQRRGLINLKKAASRVQAVDLTLGGSDTSSFCVADRDGNTVSFIHSLYSPWGSAFVAGNTGILFNNRQRGFRFEGGHPNSLGPGKRPMHTLNAYTVLKDGRPFIVGGTPGTDFQVQCNLQMITGVIDHGISPQDLVDAPRWQSTPGSEPLTLGSPFEVLLELELQGSVASRLRALGHKVMPDSTYRLALGNVQLIQMNQPTGVMMGASDQRGDGHAVAL